MNMNMENLNDDFFNEDDYLSIDPVVESAAPVEGEDDLTTEVLRLRGISDPEKIKFEDESGTIVEKSWNSLDKTEQLSILGSVESEESDLDDSEVELINAIRKSGISVEEYMSNLITPEAPKRYKVDELSDDELYALDLLEKVGSDNISDEEITQAIELAKQHEIVFLKTVEGLRNEYIRLQEDEEVLLANELASITEANYTKFATSILSEIRGLNSFIGQPLELSNNDIEDLSSFILDLDDSGVSSFGRALDDPNLFTKAAFWMLNEDKIVEELTKLMLDNYKKGYEAAKLELLNKPKVVFNPTQKPINLADDFVDDEEW